MERLLCQEELLENGTAEWLRGGMGFWIKLLMIKRKIVEAPVVDRNYINELHASIHDRLAMLDRLNENYKSKQEDHFIQSFMNVVEKMGNDLILAQEAYRNIDIEVKRDQYCMELAAELQFFKTSCFQLKTTLEKAEKTLLTLRIEKENDDTEMTAIRLSLERKIKENMSLKAQNKQLQTKIRQLSTRKQSSAQRQYFSTDPRSFRSTKQQEPNEGPLFTARRMLVSQAATRNEAVSASQHIKGPDERLTDSHTPNNQFLNYHEARNTNGPSFRRRSYQKGVNRGNSELFN